MKTPSVRLPICVLAVLAALAPGCGKKAPAPEPEVATPPAAAAPATPAPTATPATPAPAPSAAPAEPAPEKPQPTPAVSAEEALKQLIPLSVKDVRVLSPEWVVAVVDPTAEILAVRDAQYGPQLAADEAKFKEDKAAGRYNWYFNYSKRFRSLMALNSYHKPLFEKFNDPGFWKVNGKTPADVTVWAHSVDAFPGMDANDSPANDAMLFSRTADVVYLKLPEPLKNGETVKIEGADGRGGSVTFEDNTTPCWSLKVNQSAYAADSARKVAYLGMWLPGIGGLDFSAFDGKPFYVKKFEKGAHMGEGKATGEPVFTGAIQLRKKFADQDLAREGGSNLTGEDVYEMDFSGLNAEGTYCIDVPGLGRSWPFKVTKDGYGDAFYTVMKGFYTQRCGTELKKPFSAWERPACHVETKEGTFIPETSNWYTLAYRKGKPNEKDVGFRDANGERTAVQQFTLITNEDPNARVMPGVKGGWHDAADYDRRIFHYNATWDMMAAAEAFPANFKDGQLNIPESGNGTPDILDEAAWSLDVWKATQRPDGAVSSWIEQKAHPEGVEAGDLQKTFAEDPNPMFAATPDRASSFAYAGAAANLGRLLAPYSPQQSKEFIESAKKAYAWAKRDDAVMKDRKFTLTKAPRDKKLEGQTIRFDEDPEVTVDDRTFSERAFAAGSLYLATKDASYLTDWEDSGMGKIIGSRMHATNASMLVPFLVNEGLPAQDAEAIKAAVTKAADGLAASQDLHAYRQLWLAPTEGWFHAMGWGNIHSKARILAAALAATKDPKYKASMEAAADFWLGCNPTGTTTVTSLGTRYPVVLQHLHSTIDGIAQPTPGIVPYTFTFDAPMLPFILAEGGHASVKEFFSPMAIAFIPDKIGRKEIQAELDATDKTQPGWPQAATKTGKAAVWKNMPVFRRKVTHPNAVVHQNEFTVNETMSPLALLFGALTGEGYMPSDELKNREPVCSIDETPYYGMP